MNKKIVRRDRLDMSCWRSQFYLLRFLSEKKPAERSKQVCLEFYDIMLKQISMCELKQQKMCQKKHFDTSSSMRLNRKSFFWPDILGAMMTPCVGMTIWRFQVESEEEGCSLTRAWAKGTVHFQVSFAFHILQLNSFLLLLRLWDGLIFCLFIYLFLNVCLHQELNKKLIYWSVQVQGI